MSGPVPRIEIRLLGPLEVRVAGRSVELSRGRVRALLAVLASAAGRPVPADTIAERIWGEAMPADPRANLHTVIRRLRHALGPDVVSGTAGTYALQVADLDLLRFEQLLDRAEAVADDAEELRLLRDAVALWRGTPFQPHLSDWLSREEGPRLTERYLAAMERRADLELVAGAVPAELPARLRELSAAHPLRESLWLRLLGVLDATGRRADALAAYEQLRLRLADELGVDPAAELQQAHLALLTGSAAVRSADVPQQLPADLHGITGREPALARLDKTLRAARGGGALVVVHGTGGVGKTALAVHWAHRVRELFEDGQLFVDLRGFGPGDPATPEAALAVLLQGLGIGSDRIPEGVDARTGLLRATTAGRRVLVVLDNARDADQVRPLLAGDGVVTVVTSRNQLRGLEVRDSARRLGLDVLPAPDAAALLVERLKDHEVGYDDASVRRLAELCGRLPLALSIAAERAGRIPDSPLRDLVEQLSDERDRLDLLDTGGDLSTDLRAVMSWSYRALEAPAARLFGIVGLHPGPDFGVPAAAAMAGLPRRTVTRLLDRLADAHLLVRPRPARYAMHDLTRVYAAERAAADWPAPARQEALARLCSWSAWSAANAKTAIQNRRPWPEVYGAPRDDVEPLAFHDARQALAWFAAENDALEPLLRTASSLHRHDDVIMLGQSLWNYWRYNSILGAAEPVVQLTMSAARASGRKAAEATAVHYLSSVYFHTLDFERSLEQAERAYALYRDLGNDYGVCITAGSVGLAYQRLGRLDEAIETLEHTVGLARSGGWRYVQASTLNNLASAYQDVGRYTDAIRVAGAAIRISREDGQRVEEAFNLDTLALVLLVCGDPAAAIDREREALAIHRELANHWYVAFTLRQLARAHRANGDTGSQRACAEEGLRVLTDLDAADTGELSRADFDELLAD